MRDQRTKKRPPAIVATEDVAKENLRRYARLAIAIALEGHRQLDGLTEAPVRVSVSEGRVDPNTSNKTNG